MPLPADYAERVYAGVLGKIIGVYLGRPFENWSYQRIMAELGEINYYVHDQLGMPLVVTDDDITGTFTFLRALADYGHSKELTAEQIGNGWLNYLVEGETILWWGGMGLSTEHTAYLRLKAGIPAPRSGSAALNGKVVSEQIGSQIFVDGWAMVAPGDPELAVELARRAASVSHDGEAIYGAQVIAAMEAQAFVESDLNKLIDTAVAFIPQDSVIARMIEDIRQWHADEPDWRQARENIVAAYGYDKYGGHCHIVPNHALIVLSLLYGDDDLQQTLRIVNTSGWDTDCNSGNVGCLLGIKNGLPGLELGPDFRGPVADRLYLPTADGGRAITDAVTEAYHVVNMGRALAAEDPLTPKDGARFHFEMPGSVQGFEAEDSSEVRGTLRLENVKGHSSRGTRSLALHYHGLAAGRVARAATPTFIPSLDLAHYFEGRGYKLLSSPTLYSGQTVQARVKADPDNAQAVTCRLYIRPFGAGDELGVMKSSTLTLAPGEDDRFQWRIPDTKSNPIAFVGLELEGQRGASGTIFLDYLTWAGPPTTVLDRPDYSGPSAVASPRRATMWKRAWVNGLDFLDKGYLADAWPEPYRLLQNVGRGLIMQGTRDWTDYRIVARMTPHMCKAGGIGVRAQGMKRYYALLCDADSMRLIRAFDGDEVLAETAGGWQLGVPIELELAVRGNRLTASVDGEVVLEAQDPEAMLGAGMVALLCEEGRIACHHLAVEPV